jgi:hypothetical protein
MIPYKRNITLQVRRTVGKNNMKRIIYISKKTKKANNIFELVNNPISFCEMTDQYFPQSLPLPFHKVLKHLFVDNWFSFNDFCNIKDFAESIVQTYTRVMTQRGSLKQRIVLFLKIYVFIYKVSWFILGDSAIHKDYQSLTIILDYLNYFIGLIRE